mmetsp:Transcript_120049/g.301779  ORF Transcript_120049/g.301779 Transcript_120049/m.301779 type:complete len:245 (+) Transcript_120049:13-747(+)
MILSLRTLLRQGNQLPLRSKHHIMNMPSGSMPLRPLAPPWKVGKLSGNMPGTRKWSGSGSPEPGPIGSNLGRKPPCPPPPTRPPRPGMTCPQAGCRGPSRPPSGVHSSGGLASSMPPTPGKVGSPGPGRSPCRGKPGRVGCSFSGAGRFDAPVLSLGVVEAAWEASRAFPKRAVESCLASSFTAMPAAIFSCTSASADAAPSTLRVTVRSSAVVSEEAACTARVPAMDRALREKVSDAPRNGCM